MKSCMPGNETPPPSHPHTLHLCSVELLRIVLEDVVVSAEGVVEGGGGGGGTHG